MHNIIIPQLVEAAEQGDRGAQRALHSWLWTALVLYEREGKLPEAALAELKRQHYALQDDGVQIREAKTMRDVEHNPPWSPPDDKAIRRAVRMGSPPHRPPTTTRDDSIYRRVESLIKAKARPLAPAKATGLNSVVFSDSSIEDICEHVGWHYKLSAATVKKIYLTQKNNRR